MMNSLAEKLTAGQSDLKSYVQPRELLSKHQARRVKRNLITAFCEGRISETAVARAFSVFPELRSV
jgi:hypothetical protein